MIHLDLYRPENQQNSGSCKKAGDFTTSLKAHGYVNSSSSSQEVSQVTAIIRALHATA
jgi:hypothetical protein